MEWFRRKHKEMGIDPKTGQITDWGKYESVTGTNKWNVNPSTQYAPAPLCHAAGPILVFTIKTDLGNTIDVYGGASREVDLHTVDAIVDLGGMAEPTKRNPGKGFPNAKAFLQRRQTTPDYIHVLTGDGSVPRVGKDFWDVLLKDVLTVSPARLLVCCVGGHGRTGIGLAILGVLSGVIPAENDPVQWIRDKYCKKVVETVEQIRYIEEVTSRTVTAQESGFGVGLGAKKYDPYTGDYAGKYANETEYGRYDVKTGKWVAISDDVEEGTVVVLKDVSTPAETKLQEGDR